MLTPSISRQRFHFSRFALAVASSSEPAVGADPSRLSGPGLRSLAGGLDTSGSSAFSSDTPAATSIAIGDSAGRFPRTRDCPALSAKSPTTQGGMHARAMLSRFVRCEKSEHLIDRRRPRRLNAPDVGGRERPTSAFQNMPGSETIPPYTVPDARADSRERPATSSPNSDPPPMCDEENPTFGNNPNNPQALT